MGGLSKSAESFGKRRLNFTSFGRFDHLVKQASLCCKSTRKSSCSQIWEHFRPKFARTIKLFSLTNENVKTHVILITYLQETQYLDSTVFCYASLNVLAHGCVSNQGQNNLLLILLFEKSCNQCIGSICKGYPKAISRQLSFVFSSQNIVTTLAQ